MTTRIEARNAKYSARRLLRSLGVSVLTVSTEQEEATGDWFVRAVISDDFPHHMEDQMEAEGVKIKLIPSSFWQNKDYQLKKTGAG